MDKEFSRKERRGYIRLDSVFPVQFRLISLDGKQVLSEWIQGFTNNIARGGICLAVNNLNLVLARLIKEQKAKLSLRLELPIFKDTVASTARIAWINEDLDKSNKCIIGLTYEEIDPAQNNKIMHFARAKKLFVPAAIATICVLCLGFAINSFVNFQLIQGNRALVAQLITIAQEKDAAKQEMAMIKQEKEDLQTKIQDLQTKIQGLEEEKQQAQAREELLKQKGALEQQLIAIQHREDAASLGLRELEKRKMSLEKANFDKMYHWLKVHQNPRTGLVLSFEGDSDLADWAFIYDQSLVAQAYTHFGDFERARKIFSFFQRAAKRENGLFFNAYYTRDGAPAEYIVQSGPNIWLGIAIMQYTKKARDSGYVGLAEEIARSIMKLQKQDKDGGIPGGPSLDWYSTEHNLDAYAFFNMLYKVTSNTSYRQAGDQILNWLVGHTYDRQDLPVKRGRGDSTVATDTYAWSIAAIGPERLEKLGLDPERIIVFAEENCGVEVSYARPEGQNVKIKGFDFAAKQHLARGGVVSSEWTAQMIMAFKIMSDFFEKKGEAQKASYFADKADDYLSELGSMIISSPSPSGQGESCVAYATQDSVDTGHGWITPRGKTTGSLAGTAYMLFAYYNYNPLELKD